MIDEYEKQLAIAEKFLKDTEDFKTQHSASLLKEMGFGKYAPKESALDEAKRVKDWLEKMLKENAITQKDYERVKADLERFGNENDPAVKARLDAEKAAADALNSYAKRFRDMAATPVDKYLEDQRQFSEALAGKDKDGKSLLELSDTQKAAIQESLDKQLASGLGIGSLVESLVTDEQKLQKMYDAIDEYAEALGKQGRALDATTKDSLRKAAEEQIVRKEKEEQKRDRPESYAAVLKGTSAAYEAEYKAIMASIQGEKDNRQVAAIEAGNKIQADQLAETKTMNRKITAVKVITG